MYRTSSTSSAKAVAAVASSSRPSPAAAPTAAAAKIAAAVVSPRINGLPFGAAVWTTGYVILPEGAIYKTIWACDAKTLAKDLSAHLAYGAGAGAAFWLFVKIW
jgi:hypothetical protein